MQLVDLMKTTDTKVETPYQLYEVTTLNTHDVGFEAVSEAVCTNTILPKNDKMLPNNAAGETIIISSHSGTSIYFHPQFCCSKLLSVQRTFSNFHVLCGG